MQTRTNLIATAVVVAAAHVALAAASPAARPQERFTITGKTVRGKDGPIRVVAAGSIRGSGRATFVDHGKTSKGTFHLAGGDVYVTFVGKRSVSHADPAACRATVDYSGTFTIRGGTHRYRTAAGRGTFQEHRKLVGQRDQAGNCLQQATPETVTVVNHARGTASLR
jgi:hypothetical protein